MTLRRATAGLLGAAPFAPPLVWLFPALVLRRAPTFRDQGDFFYPLKLYTADRLAAGEIPLWNPMSGAGEPWLANLQSGVFYPPGAFFLLPFPAAAAALFLLFHFAAAAWGMARFLREEGSSDAASACGAALFAASGFAASLSAYWNHFGAFAWLPAAASYARSGLHRRRDRLALGAVLGLQAMAGSPEISAATVAVCALLVWRSRPAAEGGYQPSGGRRLARFAAAAALGLALAGWALLPFAELARSSQRRVALPAAERDAGAIRWRAAASVTGSGGDSGTVYLASLAFGPLALAAAAAAFLERERRRLTLLLAAVAVVGVLLASAGPPGAFIRSLPPLDRIRYPAKALVPAAFALAALAGLGFDALRFSPAARRRTFLAVAAAAGALLLAVSARPRVALALELVGLAALLAPAVLRSDRPERAAALHAVAAVALVAALAVSGGSLFRFAPEGEVRRRGESLAFLSTVPGRVLTPPMGALVPFVLKESDYEASTLRRQRESLVGYTNLLSGIRTVRTASPLPTEGAARIADAIDGARDLQRAAGCASARLLWTPFPPVEMGSRKVGEFYRAPINPYRPRLSFARAFSVEPDAQKAWSRRAAWETDWTSGVFLDRPPAPAPVSGSARKGFLLARLVEDRPERVVADVNADGAGIVVLTDLIYPGWKAETDGRPSEILRADGVFRAVAVSAGAHRIVFSYRPISFYAGAALSAAALLVLFVLARAGEPRRPGALL